MNAINYIGTDVSPHTGKFGCKFDVLRDEKLVVAECTSGHVFDTPEEAMYAGMRAVLIVQSWGKLPNLCAKW